MRAWLGQGGRSTSEAPGARGEERISRIHLVHFARDPHLPLRLGSESGFGGSVAGHRLAVRQPSGAETRVHTREMREVRGRKVELLWTAGTNVRTSAVATRLEGTAGETATRRGSRVPATRPLAARARPSTISSFRPAARSSGRTWPLFSSTDPLRRWRQTAVQIPGGATGRAGCLRIRAACCWIRFSPSEQRRARILHFSFHLAYGFRLAETLSLAALLFHVPEYAREHAPEERDPSANWSGTVRENVQSEMFAVRMSFNIALWYFLPIFLVYFHRLHLD
jgi:hypothetical protein